MEIFSYNPSTNRETLKEFNERISEFCLENAVVAIQAQVIHSALVLGMTLADDIDADDVPTYMTVVRAIEATDVDLEEQMQKMLETINAQNTEEDPRIPIEVKIVARQDKPTKGWAVFQVVNGMVDQEEGEGEPTAETEENPNPGEDDAGDKTPAFAPEKG